NAATVDWVFQGLERFGSISLSQIGASLLTLLLTVALVRSPGDVYLVPVLPVVGQVLVAGLLVGALCREGLVSFRGVEWNLFAAILRGVLPLALSGVMVTVLHYANNVFVYWYRGRTELGLFAVGFRLWEILTPVPMLIANVFLPHLA